MRIIKPGIIKEMQPVSLICYKCSCEFEAIPQEDGKYRVDPRDGNYYAFNCPTCNNEIYKALT